MKSRSLNIKREQKKSFLLREVAALVRQVALDEPKLSILFVTRIELSKDSGICYVYISTHTDKEAYEEGLEILKLYKPSMRKALAQAMHTRYVPNLRFRYDESKDKERRINELFAEIGEESDK